MPVLNPANLAVEVVCLALYIVLAGLSVALFFGRKSYDIFVTIFYDTCNKTVSQKSEESKKKQRAQASTLNLIITCMNVYIFYRIASEAVRVAAHSIETPNADLSKVPIEQASTILLILGYPFFTYIFCMLVWMWLRLGFVLFTGSKNQLNCMLWTIRLLMAGSILGVVAAAGVILVFQAVPEWKYGNYRPTYLATGAVVGSIFFVIMLFLTVLACALGIRIAVLVCASIKARKQTGSEEVAASTQHRKTLMKLSVAVICFAVGMNLRVVGLAAIFLNLPYWVFTLFLIALPEFLCFGTLVLIMWPFKVTCCHHRLFSPDALRVNGSLEAKQRKADPKTPAQQPQTPAYDVLSSTSSVSTPVLSLSTETATTPRIDVAGDAIAAVV